MSSFDVISVDLFDTVLLRDNSTLASRFYESSHLLAKELSGQVRLGCLAELAELKTLTYRLAYRAAGIERPLGDVKLLNMLATQALLLGFAPESAGLFHSIELEVESHKLAPNRALLVWLHGVAASGKRVIATSDTFYSAEDLDFLIKKVTGQTPFHRIYSSGDIGMTKRGGRIYEYLAQQEQVEPNRIFHFGDDWHSDVAMATQAGINAFHLPRPLFSRLLRKSFAAFYLAVHLRSFLSL